MGFTNCRVGVTYYVSLCVVLCLWLYGSNGATSSFKIFRGEQDIFTNMKCNPESESCNEVQCKNYSAECVDAKLCHFCRCMVGKNTFMIHQGQGACKSDEEIIPESVPDEAFWLKDNDKKKCLKLEGSSQNYVIGTDCNTWRTFDSLWIRTNTNGNKFFIMNVKTLKCMKRGESNTEKVTMNQCENTNWQKLRCNDNSNRMKILWRVGDDRRFLRLHNQYAIYSTNLGDQRWISKQGTSCIRSTVYKGCYRFSDGSFMKYLKYNETNPELSISAPIFKENNGDCNVQGTFKFTKNGQQWKDDRGSFFSMTKVSGDTKKLKIRSMENLKRFNGSLLNLAATCQKDGSEETHCVLLKLESLPSFSEEINRSPSPSPSITSKGKVTTGVTTKKTPASSVHSPTSLTSTSQKESAREETSESGGTNSAAIAVPVTLFLVALALVIGYLVYCRRRKTRAQRQQDKNNATIGMVNCSKDIYEEPDRIYETLKDDEVPPNEPGTSSDIYSYPDSNPTVPASTEQEYTYADDRNFPRSSLSTKQAAKEAINKGAVYETLEQPTDDFYNYPDDTNIPNQQSPEREYTYAKDKDLPRSIADRKTAPKRDSEPDTGNALYHTLEEEGITPTEQEYSYAKNTDMPLIPLSAQQRNNGHSSRPASNSALYPPQLPVYSTLEKPDDVENPQVTKETPNRSDHTYVDVIDGSNSTHS